MNFNCHLILKWHLSSILWWNIQILLRYNSSKVSKESKMVFCWKINFDISILHRDIFVICNSFIFVVKAECHIVKQHDYLRLVLGALYTWHVQLCKSRKLRENIVVDYTLKHIPIWWQMCTTKACVQRTQHKVYIPYAYSLLHLTALMHFPAS